MPGQMFGAIKKMFKRGGSGSQDTSAAGQPAAEQEPIADDSSAGHEAPSYSAGCARGITGRFVAGGTVVGNRFLLSCGLAGGRGVLAPGPAPLKHLLNGAKHLTGHGSTR